MCYYNICNCISFWNSVTRGQVSGKSMSFGNPTPEFLARLTASGRKCLFFSGLVFLKNYPWLRARVMMGEDVTILFGNIVLAVTEG